MNSKEMTKSKKEFMELGEGNFINFLYPEVEIKSPANMWNQLIKQGWSFSMTPKVGDLVLFRKYYRGNSQGGAVIGVVSKVSGELFSYLVDQREVKARLNFGSSNGYVVEGFLKSPIEEIKEEI